jgi:hypothetical protein
MTAEQALMKLLEAQVRSYDKLKFEEGEAIHPTILVVMAAMEMGWNISIPHKEDDELTGMSIGTDEYLNELFKDKKHGRKKSS